MLKIKAARHTTESSPEIQGKLRLDFLLGNIHGLHQM
jgi:hypothetical protein